MPPRIPFAPAWLESTIGSGRKRGLANMRAVMAELGDPHAAFPVAHITGTNGKGSTASFLASILDAAGLRVGLFTSPHLVHPRERICVGRSPIAASALDRAARRVADACRARDVHPIYFEATAMTAMAAFAAAGIDFAVVEVGVGGRLDATNVVAPEVCAITEIGFDHEKALGNTLQAIATEKLGIVKPGAGFVTGCADPALAAFVLAGARERGAEPALSVDDRPPSSSRQAGSGERFHIEHPRFGPLPVRLRMAGAHQARNARCAIELAALLAGRGFPVTPAAVLAGLARAVWPARFERILARRPPLYIDAAHNESGAESLAVTAVRRFGPAPATLVFGIFRDKRVAGVVERLAGSFARVVATRAPSDRAAEPEELAALFRARGVAADAVDDPVAAVRHAFAVTPEDGSVTVAGSIYLAGLVRAAFTRRRFRPF